MAELALGSAQFGLDYGINNKRGRIPGNEVFDILDFAAKNGISTIDTADCYGESEKVIGDYLGSHKGGFKVVSKYSSDDFKSVKEKVLSSLSKLRSERLYGYLLHSFGDYAENKKIWHDMEEVRSGGLAGKTGFSLYYPEELETILADGLKFDLVQVPYSVLDQRFDKYFRRLKDMGVEIHARSAFLQGLLLRLPSQLSGKFADIRGKIEALNGLAKGKGLAVSTACLCFALLNGKIDKVIVGVDGLDNLRENVASLEHREKVLEIMDELKRLKEYNEDVIIPMNWSDRS